MKCTTSHPAAAGGLKGCSLSNHETIWADIADLVDINCRGASVIDGPHSASIARWKLTAPECLINRQPSSRNGSRWFSLFFFGPLLNQWTKP